MTQRLYIALLIWAALVAAPAVAQNYREELGQAAERAGQFSEALRHYTAALQATAARTETELGLFERAATVAAKVRPLPPLPAEAERHFLRGQAAVQSARDVEGFMRAAEEFHAAVRAAPWFADAHYNLGVVLDKAQRYSAALRSLKLYMLAAPDAKDAASAQRLIYQIEFRQEEAARSSSKAATEVAAKAEEQLQRLGFLVGRWSGTMTANMYLIDPSLAVQRGQITMDIAINGSDVTMTRVNDGKPELIGKLMGSDASSIRWEFPPQHAYAGERAQVLVTPTRIYFAQPVRRSNGARINGVMEYELRR